MGKHRPTSWLLGFAGSALVHVCVLAALFAFGRGVRDRAGGGDAARDTIALDPTAPAFAVPDPLATAIPIDVEPPARAWDAHESDRDSLVPSTTAPSASAATSSRSSP